MANISPDLYRGLESDCRKIIAMVNNFTANAEYKALFSKKQADKLSIELGKCIGCVDKAIKGLDKTSPKRSCYMQLQEDLNNAAVKLRVATDIYLKKFIFS